MLTADQIPWRTVVDQPPTVAFQPCRQTDVPESRRVPEYRDWVITELADGEAVARERVVVLEADNATLRDMVHECLARLARESAHLEAARRTIQVLRHAERQHGRAARAVA